MALALQQAGFLVGVVNEILIHNFSDNSLRKVKMDTADALKIANYGLTFWMDLREYSAEDETRQMLKIQNRLCERTTTTGTMLRNGLISLLDQTFTGANKLLLNEGRNSKGYVKWVNFVITFWCKECATASDTFPKWCKRAGYRFSTSDAEQIHTAVEGSGW